MANFRSLTLQSGITTNIGDADQIVVGAGVTTAAGNLTISSAGGTTALSDNITLAANKNLTPAAGTGAFDLSAATGLFKTPTGAVTIGPGAVGISGDTTLAANKNISMAAGTGLADFSLGTGIFKTSTGAVTVGPGATTMSGVTTFTAAGTALTVNNNALVSGNMSITGNLTVTGSTFSTAAEQVLINDNHLYLNNAYTADPAQTGGLVINYDPTTLTTTVNAAYVAGVAATSNPTVGTTGAATFAASDLIQFSGGTGLNPGLYEVLTHAANVLTVRGIGVTATVEDFTQNQFVAGASDGATIVKVNVSIIRSGTDGLWEVGKGAVTPVTFSDLSTAATATLQSTYQAGNTITTSGGFGNITFNGTEDFVVGGSVDLAFTSTGGFSWTSATGAINLQTTSTMTLRGGGVSIFGDDVGAFSFNGTGALTTTGLTSASITPSGAITLTAGAASTWSTSAGALTITAAAASTWSTSAGALTVDSAAALNLGTTNATSTTLGRTGTIATVLGTIQLTGDSAALFSTSAGTITINAATTVNIATATSTSVAIGHVGITTTVTGGLTQLTGAVSLTGNAASSFTTSTGALTLTAAAASTWSTSAGALTLTSAAAATWSTAAGALTLDSAAALNLGTVTATSVSLGRTGITTTNNGALTVTQASTHNAGITVTGGAVSLTGNASSTFTTSAGTITINAATTLNLGTATSTSVDIGHAGIPVTLTGSTITVTGNLTQLTGAVSLSANAASSFTTSAGALTLTSATAATWSTSAGALTINGTGGINLQGGGTTALTVNSAGTAITVQSGATLSTTGTGNIDLPSLFKIATVSTSANVSAANLGTLTAGAASNADALHTHTAAIASATQISATVNGTTGILAIGSPVVFANDGGNPRVFNAFATTAANARGVGLATTASAITTAVLVRTSGELLTADAAWDSVPAAADVGKRVYISETTSGKLTITAPATSGSTVLRMGHVTAGGSGTTKVGIAIGEAAVI